MAKNKIQATILATLGVYGGTVHRTKLVKLIYLIDNRFYELTGQTLTGLKYMWDHHGPNAVSDAIVNELSLLTKTGKVHMNETTSSYGGPAYIYKLEGDWRKSAEAHLTPTELNIIQSVVHEFGQMNVTQIVNASKQTQPFKNAQRYDVLKMEQSKPAKELADRLTSTEGFIESARNALEEAKRGDGKDLEEVDREFGFSTASSSGRSR